MIAHLKYINIHDQRGKKQQQKQQQQTVQFAFLSLLPSRRRAL